jgi:hypothetical protein
MANHAEHKRHFWQRHRDDPPQQADGAESSAESAGEPADQLPPLTREEELDIPPETAAEIDDGDEKLGDEALGEASWLRSSD